MADTGMARWRDAPPRAYIAHEGDRNEYCHVLLDGLVVQEKIIERGRRQIVGMHVPGDVCGLFALSGSRMHHDLVALSPVSYLSVRRQWLSYLAQETQDLREAVWREMSREAAISAVWLANMGQRSAYQRIAHLICELNIRLQTSACHKPRGFKWTGTQTDLRAATGLSLVHVNKTLRRLEDEHLISCGRNIAIHDAAKLEIVADFNPAYLARDRESLGEMLLSRIERPETARSAELPCQLVRRPDVLLVVRHEHDSTWFSGRGVDQ